VSTKPGQLHDIALLFIVIPISRNKLPVATKSVFTAIFSHFAKVILDAAKCFRFALLRKLEGEK
jgi:hypothetical protein